MTIGFGIVSSRGRGIKSMQNPFSDEFAVVPATLKDKDVLKGMRRADRFSKMTALAAYDAVVDADLLNSSAELGIIVSTQFGPHASTFKFLDDLLDYGDGESSPTTFSHSVHNAAAHYTATTIQSRGPSTTVTTFNKPFAQALDLAYAWLNEGRVDQVVVGYVEERSKAMDYIVSELKEKHDMLYAQEFRFEDSSPIALSEGAVFLACKKEDKDILPVIANDIRGNVLQSVDNLFVLINSF